MADRKSLLSIIDSHLSDQELEDLAEAVQIVHVPAAVRPDDDLEGEIANGSIDALRTEAERNRTNWKLHFAEGALVSKKEVDQREVDYKRGYFAGVDYYLNWRIKLAKSRLVRRAVEHSERSGE